MTANEEAFRIPGHAAARQVEAGRTVCHDSRESLLLRLDLFPLRKCKPGVAGGKPSRALRAFRKIDGRQLLRILDRQRTQTHGIHKLKNRRVGPDTKRQRQNGNRRKARIHAQLPEAVTDVLPNGLEPLCEIHADIPLSSDERNVLAVRRSTKQISLTAFPVTPPFPTLLPVPQKLRFPNSEP
jgi:hypothetical protein